MASLAECNFCDASSLTLLDVHSLGLKFGLYTDRSNLTCARRPGAWGHEQGDAETYYYLVVKNFRYAAWQIDYLKEDSCGTKSNSEAEAILEYGKMRDALNSTGRPIFFSLCGWEPYAIIVGLRRWINIIKLVWCHRLPVGKQLENRSRQQQLAGYHR